MSNQVSTSSDAVAKKKSEFRRHCVAFYSNEPEPDSLHYFVCFKPLSSSIEVRDGPPQRGIPNDSWKYCMCISLSEYSCRSDLIIWTGIPVYQNGYLRCSAAGRLDYIPPWELREHNGQLYHIDDREMSCPVPFSEALLDSLQIQVPYAFMPPSRINFTPIASTGITVDWDLLQQCLGDLYSVPPDGRLPLSFERNELRLKCASGEIHDYLRRISAFFEDLHGKKGSLFVRDFDRYLDQVTYTWEDGRKRPLKKELPYWIAANHARVAEQTHLYIRPGDYALESSGWGEASNDEQNRKYEKPVICRPVQRTANNRLWHRIVLF